MPLHPMRRLIFAGKAMNDDKMAKDYNIEVRGRCSRLRRAAAERLERELHSWPH